MYTAQVDAHGNIIVCRGEVQRNGYTTVFKSSYYDCLNYKLKHSKEYTK